MRQSLAEGKGTTRIKKASALHTGKQALMFSGSNHSDDLFMFLKKKISGPEPGRTYAVIFNVELASVNR